MTYFGMPFGMWTLFTKSFRKQLTEVFGYDTDTAKTITKKAKTKYKEIICELPEFEKGDRFKANLVNCAMIGAFILSMPEHPAVYQILCESTRLPPAGRTATAVIRKRCFKREEKL